MKRWDHSLVFSLPFFLVFFCFSAPGTRAETLELVTYYPTSSSNGPAHFDSLTIGSGYQGAVLTNGQALIETGLGIGTGFDTTPPQAALHVNGGLFLQGGSGDANNDGSITSGDATKILDYLNGTATLTPGEYARSDVNGDGQVTSADYLELQRKLALADPASAFTSAEHATLKQIVDRTIQTDLNRNVSIGEPPAAGGYTAPDGTTTGNLSVHDVFLRSTGQWASQSNSSRPDAVGTYTGDGANDRFISTSFKPGHVMIWLKHGNHMHCQEVWAGMPLVNDGTFNEVPGFAFVWSGSSMSGGSDLRQANLRIVAGERGFHVGGSNSDFDMTNQNGQLHRWMAWK